MNKETPSPEAESATTAKDYGKASPGEIMADIEKTRAHMDETLSLLGDKIHSRPGKRTLISLAATVAAAGGLLAWRLMAARKKSPHRKMPWLWRSAGILEQALLAKKLVGAARKGKPAIIVVEPRKI